jgi:hypothetical protein
VLHRGVANGEVRPAKIVEARLVAISEGGHCRCCPTGTHFTARRFHRTFLCIPYARPMLALYRRDSSGVPGGSPEGTFLCIPYACPMAALCSAHQPQHHVTPGSQVTFCSKCPPHRYTVPSVFSACTLKISASVATGHSKPRTCHGRCGGANAITSVGSSCVVQTQ